MENYCYLIGFPLNREAKEKGMRFEFQRPLVDEALRDTPNKGGE